MDGISKVKNRDWYLLNSLLGNQWAMFFFLLGAREAGKSYAVLKYCIKQWKEKQIPFVWLRLKPEQTKKLLLANAMDFVDPDLRRKYDLKLETVGEAVYDDGKLMCRIMNCGTFYNDKGVAYFDNEYTGRNNIVLDEMNREQGEKNTFDIAIALANQLENLIRTKKENVRIFLIGNNLDIASDILSRFNFIPKEFGRYYLKSKRAVVDYIAPSENYKKRRKGSASAIILGDNNSSFDNIVKFEFKQAPKGQGKILFNIAFSNTDRFSYCENNTVRGYTSNQKPTYSFVPYTNYMYHKDVMKDMFNLFHSSMMYFENQKVYRQFLAKLRLVKPSG